MTREPFSLYIHVPFCSQKCPYCDFNTYATPRVPEQEYVSALCREVQRYADHPGFSGRGVGTIFFGGGTPSLLSPSAIGEVIRAIDDRFGIEQGGEVTLEANPSSSDTDRYRRYRDAGINRVSFGVQSFNDERLRLLGRDHSSRDARLAVERCVEAGISNVSVDIIFGVSDQTMGDLRRDLAEATALPIAHLSTYSLTIEPGTPFFQRQERGLLVLPPDDLVAEMLSEIPSALREKGFERYEVSNYAKPGMESKHNTAYWIGVDYLGIGAGAHSYLANYDGERLVGATRWSTLALPATYMEAAGTERTASWRESLSAESLEFEFFYLGLRRTCGVSPSRFERLFGTSPLVRYGDVLRDLASEGFLTSDSDRIALTERGIALADSVVERFVR
jgi:oxygen-independent coproporphyrinogen III oxidase